jgi:hypothetical protein
MSRCGGHRDRFQSRLHTICRAQPETVPRVISASTEMLVVRSSVIQPRGWHSLPKVQVGSQSSSQRHLARPVGELITNMLRSFSAVA